ncbi:phenylalanine--tRNA ligase subunit alpha [Evansella cellulosilytica]|uniref:Phenylalanine--tRNA ligase alpha subunit n=1 Tax=Evansella cellulosilytica (strain ATCC 21833 / DSM 2522 / FERM P-1141 / JCM 9156 / N-4) TaxID=649639 RepID=E6U0I2_EVAC2|nr:phenylalanine--tRNA ligase subunit alpha [Evansella cellulosilytica]ADU31427.1 phenylalanyl-tRNA synthetase, alpha subunit [Evansella cellulosilytica DSM 2522]
MIDRLQQLKDEAITKANEATTIKELKDLRVSYLGKKGPITEVLKGMGKLSADERPKVGQAANEVREAVATVIEEKEQKLEEAALTEKLKSESIDVTLPGRPINKGSRHPLTSVVETIEDIFIGMGFTVAEGPEVETDYYNFESLNLPKDHPARDMQDTFFITNDLLLRTQTSPVQTRTMEKHEGRGPVKIICPGKVYRRDEDDATHSHQFMQIEGLVVDEGIRMSDLKGIFEQFVKKYFGEGREIRLRPSFFPFTEPSAELDVSCAICGGDGCRTCKQTGWIEVLGSGMVHPNVLRMSGFDPEKYTGFAFGMGVERFAMLKYGVDDIRHFYTNDTRFLSQFKRV